MPMHGGRTTPKNIWKFCSFIHAHSHIHTHHPSVYASWHDRASLSYFTLYIHTFCASTRACVYVHWWTESILTIETTTHRAFNITIGSKSTHICMHKHECVDLLFSLLRCITVSLIGSQWRCVRELYQTVKLLLVRSHSAIFILYFFVYYFNCRRRRYFCCVSVSVPVWWEQRLFLFVSLIFWSQQRVTHIAFA